MKFLTQLRNNKSLLLEMLWRMVSASLSNV